MKQLTMILVICILIVSSAFSVRTSAADGIKYGELYYELNDEGTAVIITGCDRSATTVIVPDKINNLPVTEIGRKQTSTGGGAFIDCTNLISVTIPSSITRIGTLAFDGCTNLTNINIPNGVTSIGHYAFGGCSSLTNITIPDSVTSIGSSSFSGCSNLTRIALSNSLTSIEFGVFAGCSSLTSITIPSSVTRIGTLAFDRCTNLTNIIIPDTVISIDGQAFQNCDSLTSITIPSSVTSIHKNAFYKCYNLSCIYVDSQNPVYCSIDGHLFSKDRTMLFRYTAGNKNISYTLPESVISIDDASFEDCTHLINITLPNSLTLIGDGAFGGCSSLKSISIPESVTRIGNFAFNECNNLKNITIPNSISNIDFYTFRNCSNLTDVYYSGTKEQWQQITIAEGNENLTNASVHYNNQSLITCTISNGSLTATLSGVEKNAIVLVTELDTANRLLRITLHPITTPQQETTQLLLSATSSVKVFLWENLRNMIPIAPIVTESVK